MNGGDMAAIGFSLAKKIAERLDLNKRYYLARMIGNYSAKLLREKYRTVRENLEPVLGECGKNPDETALEIFKNFSVTLADFFTQKDLMFSMHGLEHLEKMRRNNLNFIILTFHLGFWEFGTHVLGKWGWPATAVYQQYQSRKLHDFIQSLRSPEIDYIKVRKDAAHAAIDALRKKKILVMLGDRVFGEAKPIKLPMFGKHTYVPRGPAVIASRCGVPIVPAFIIREEDGRYTGYMENPIVPEKNTGENMSKFIIMLSEVLQKYIIRYPGQWYRFERVWV